MAPGLMIFLVALGFAIGIIVGSGIRRHRPHFRVGNGDNSDIERERIRAKDRAEARAMLERLAEKKIEVVKDAIAMGYGEAQLDRLDARLEKLVGPEKLQELLSEVEQDPLPGEDLSADRTSTRSRTERE